MPSWKRGAVLSVIVIHSGMPKAGSTSLQQWLEGEAVDLRQRGFTVAALSHWDDEGNVDFAPYERGEVNFSAVISRFGREPGPVWQRFADSFVSALSSCGERYGNIIVSGEALAMHPRRPILERLQQLATQHEVRVAYYARPQHTSLEAMWREWGYRSGKKPSVCVELATPSHRYAFAQRAIHSIAPNLKFEIRPFREDMLDGGDIGVDFARRFLGVEAHGTGIRANRGLPLEMVNLLRYAPHGMFWDDLEDYERLHRVKELYADQSPLEDHRVALSRKVLRRYAFDVFAAENAELGWDDFVAPLEEGEDVPELKALDGLWTPRASSVELSLLFHALRAAIGE
jgi:hypothetical protein